MNIGERFKMSRKEYEVKDRLGSGGQGTAVSPHRGTGRGVQRCAEGGQTAGYRDRKGGSVPPARSGSIEAGTARTMRRARPSACGITYRRGRSPSRMALQEVRGYGI